MEGGLERGRTYLEHWVLRDLRTKRVQYLALHIPEIVLPLLLLRDVPLDRDVYDGASRDTRREEQRRELD